MSKNIEKIDRYIRNVNLPEYESDQHRHKLRRQILSRNERRHTMSVGDRFWKIAALITIVLSAGAIAATVGVKIYRYRFEGQDRNGVYHFSLEKETIDAENGNTVRLSRSVAMTISPNDVMDVEQKIKDLEEIDLLRQQDERELVRVTEKEVNGKPQTKSFGFKYVLSDGREETMGEGDPDTLDRERSLTEEQQEELLSLQRAGKEEYIGIEEKEVRGRVFVFKRQRYILSDGTEVIWSTGEPK